MTEDLSTTTIPVTTVKTDTGNTTTSTAPATSAGATTSQQPKGTTGAVAIPPIKMNLHLPVTNGLDPTLRLLFEILKLRRVANGRAEAAMIEQVIKPTGAVKDQFGNYVVRIPKADNKPSKVLWSTHTDTVHHSDGVQNIIVEKDTGILYLAGDEKDKWKDDCLGADDGAGVWLLLQMIEHKVPGTYVFHREEETGRKGSTWRAANRPKELRRLKAAIAFDRRGTKSIISHQMGTVRCSDEFIESLAKQLGMGHTKDKTGSYTDTASYSALISECTNVSVGYANEHSSRETLDTKYLLQLRDKMIIFNENLLVTKRKPVEPYTYKPAYSNGGYKGRSASPYGSEDDLYGENYYDGYYKRAGWATETLPSGMSGMQGVNALETGKYSTFIGANSYRLAAMFLKWNLDMETLGEMLLDHTGVTIWTDPDKVAEIEEEKEMKG